VTEQSDVQRQIWRLNSYITRTIVTIKNLSVIRRLVQSTLWIETTAEAKASSASAVYANLIRVSALFVFSTRRQRRTTGDSTTWPAGDTCQTTNDTAYSIALCVWTFFGNNARGHNTPSQSLILLIFIRSRQGSTRQGRSKYIPQCWYYPKFVRVRFTALFAGQVEADFRWNWNTLPVSVSFCVLCLLKHICLIETAAMC